MWSGGVAYTARAWLGVWLPVPDLGSEKLATMLPSHLGVPQIYVHDINRNSTEESERRSNFFFGWKELKGSAATYKALITALLDIDCREDAEGVCRFLKKTKIQPLPQHVQSMYNDSRPPEGIYLIFCAFVYRAHMTYYDVIE